MSLVNISIVEGHRVLVLWTVMQIEPNLTFVHLFEIIRAGHHPRINTAKLLHTELERVLVGLSKSLISQAT